MDVGKLKGGLDVSRIWLPLLSAFALCVLSAGATADGIDDAALKRILGDAGTKGLVVKPLKNDDALRLTMNRDQIVRLDQDAASVIVNNPAHAEVLLDSPRLLIVMPRAAGATSFTVLNAKGETILRRDIIVTNVQPKYVRIRRICTGADATCVPAAYYYCPDGCYEVTQVGSTGSGDVPAPAAAAATAAQLGGAPTTPDSGASAAPAAALPAVTGDGSEAPNSGESESQPVGSDGEPLTTPGQQP